MNERGCEPPVSPGGGLAKLVTRLRVTMLGLSFPALLDLRSLSSSALST
jgi:hypothetical protein